MAMRRSYREMMRAHCDEGGTLDHRNGMDLLAEVERLNEALIKIHDVAKNGTRNAAAWNEVLVIAEMTLAEAKPETRSA
jgi:hypothetical protein